MPQDAAGGQGTRGQGSGGNGQWQGRRSQGANGNADAANTGGQQNNAQQNKGPQDNGQQNNGQQGNRTSSFAPASAPVLEGQTRLVWVLGQDGKAQSRRIKVGLTDGVSTEVVEGNLQEGELVITGQTVTNASKSNTNQTSAPGFGGAPRTGGGGGGGRRQ